MFENKRLTRIILSALAVLGLTLSILAHFKTRFPGDLQTTLTLQAMDSQSLFTVMKGISYATGDWQAAILVIVGGIIVWWRTGGLEGGMVLLSGLVATINEIFKIVINRPRPPADLVHVFVAETGKSFPSGHAFLSVVFLGLTAYFFVTHQTRRYQKGITVLLFVVLALLVGISRVYLGVHWVSDVVGGYVMGLLFLALEIWLYQRLRRTLVNRNVQRLEFTIREGQ